MIPQCANDASMRQIIYDGREWTLCTITKYDQIDEGGGHPRAQWISTEKLEDGQTYWFSFEVIIPKDWQINTDYVNIHDLHARSTKGTYFCLYIVENKFRLVYTPEGPGGPSQDWWMHWIPDHPYRFDVQLKIGQQGFMGYDVNGQEWFKKWGPTLWPDDKWPYWKVGPYQATSNWNDPKVDYRRMMVRV